MNPVGCCRARRSILPARREQQRVWLRMQRAASVSARQPVELHAGAPMLLTLTLKIEKNVESVTVTASDGYATTVQTTGSRVPIRVLDLPQSTYTVTHQLLEDRGVDSLKDALAGVPGIQPTLGEGRRDSFDIRGFTPGTDQD